MLNDILWAEIYRPKTLDECLLPPSTKSTLAKYIKKRAVPHLLFSGPPGIGKTTAALVLAHELDAESILLNGSLDGNIDTLRTKIQQFASTMAMNGERKFIIFDEADGLTAATQNALRAFVDEFGGNCTFIFTCNFRNKLIAPLSNSRITELSFGFNRDELPDLAKQLFVMLTKMMEDHLVWYDSKAVQKFIVSHLKKSYDIRKLINDVQKISVSGVFDGESTLDNISGRFDQLIAALKEKNYSSVRTWIGENTDIDPSLIYRYLFDNAKSYTTVVPAVVLIVAKYQYQQAFVVDSEINLAACMVELMTECVGK